MYMAYLPLLWEFMASPGPLVSFGSAARMYATSVVRMVHGIEALSGGTAGIWQVQRLSPPAASAASIAAITRSVTPPLAARKAFTALGTTAPDRRIFPWME